MYEDIFTYGVGIGLIVIVGGMLYFFGKKIGPLLIKPYGNNANPYLYKELKNIGIITKAKIIEINSDGRINEYKNTISGNIVDEGGLPFKQKYYILEFTDKNKKKYTDKIYGINFKWNINVSDFFLKKTTLKKFKVGDSIKCYINPKNNKEYYIDPEDIFVNRKK